MADKIFPSDNTAKSVYGFMRDAAEHGVKFFVCSGAVEGLGVSMEDLIPECGGVVGVTAYMARVIDDEWKSLSY